MDDLPKSAAQSKLNQSDDKPSMSKELESVQDKGLESALKDVATYEVELSKEMKTLGVKSSSTQVQIPPPIGKLGVKASGDHQILGSGATVALPLTDDQIASGLRQSVISSWRWLAEWCLRRLKKLRIAFYIKRGKLSRLNK